MAAVVLAAAVMDVLDSSILNVAGPAVRADLGGGAGTLQWLSASYTLAFAVLVIVGGRLGDIFGRRRMFLFGVVTFALSSAAIGFSPNDAWLIAGRSIQGIGAAFMMPATLSIISNAFPPHERGKITVSDVAQARTAEAHRAAANNTVKRLNAAFDKLWAKCSWFLGDIFPANPTAAWKQRLNAPAADDVAQSFYDFVKDVVESVRPPRFAVVLDRVGECGPRGAEGEHHERDDGADLDRHRVDADLGVALVPAHKLAVDERDRPEREG